jgi:hypothetical protein
MIERAADRAARRTRCAARWGRRVDTIEALTRYDEPIVWHQRWIVPHDCTIVPHDGTAHPRQDLDRFSVDGSLRISANGGGWAYSPPSLVLLGKLVAVGMFHPPTHGGL